MSNVFLLNYKVKGIKTLDEEVSLSFYKKTITTPIDTQKYNIKGIYGMNGSGKSGIITSVEILRSILVDSAYLNNPMVQKKLDAIINKKTRELYIEVEFLLELGVALCLIFKYNIVLQKNTNENFEIYKEQLSYKNTNGKKIIPLLEIKKGEIENIFPEKREDIFRKKTTNLLSKSTAVSLFMEKIFIPAEITQEDGEMLFWGLWTLFTFGNSIYVYMEQSDKHTDYFLQDVVKYYVDTYNMEQSDKHTDYYLEVQLTWSEANQI